MNKCFTPQRIAGRSFDIPGEIIARSVDADIEFARIDEMSVRYPYGSSLRKSLSRLEAIATTSISGPAPNLLFMIWLNAMHVHDANRVPRISECPFHTSDEAARAAMNAVRYMRAVDNVVSGPQDTPLTQDWLKSCHSYLSFGTDTTKAARYRDKDFPKTPANYAYLGKLYCPPKPRDIPALMDDLFKFIATPRYTPSVHAAIAHFQLQAICPFDSMMDRTERILSLALLHRAKIASHLAPCIGFALASGLDNYTRMLMPYHHPDARSMDSDSWIANWIRCCTADLRDAITIVKTYMSRMSDIVGSYQEKVGTYRKGSAVDIIMRELPGLPLIDTAIGMNLTGKGYTAISDALKLLEQCGVVKRITSSKRNRLFVAVEVIQAEQSILETFLPKKCPNHDILCF